MAEENNILNENELEQVTGGSQYKRLIKYVVVKGDSLNRLSHTFHCTVGDIMALNPIIQKPQLIRVGWILLIPDNR